MQSDLKICEKMALSLPLRQRARLAEHLLFLDKIELAEKDLELNP